MEIYKYEGKKADIAISAYGAMTTVRFHTPNGDVAPLFEREWEKTEDEFMNHLRGDFFSTPFGSNPDDFSIFPEGWRKLEQSFEKKSDPAHGYGAHNYWKLKKYLKNGLVLEIEYPEGGIIGTVTRQVTVREDGYAIDFRDDIEIRKDGSLPLGLHPIFRLSEQAGMTELKFPVCKGVRTYPIDTDETSVFIPDQWVFDLRKIPLRNGGTVDATKLPLTQHTEELLLLCSVEKSEVALWNREEGYRVKLVWDGEILRNCLFWMSNRGRKFQPWNGTNLCLGVEPVTAAFDLGKIISLGENPLKKEGICTSADVKCGENISLSHSIELLEY